MEDSRDLVSIMRLRRSFYHPCRFKSPSQWEVVRAHVGFCVLAHNVFMDVIIQPSSKILWLAFIGQSSSVCLGAKLEDPLVLKALV